MNDADHTIQATDADLERIRQLVQQNAAPDGSSPAASVEEPVDRTIVADPETLERIRRIASGELPVDRPLPQPGPLEPPKFDAAPLPPPSAQPAIQLAPRPSTFVPLGPESIPTPRDRAETSAAKTIPRPPGRDDDAPWVPPPRSVRPERPTPTTDNDTRRWKLATVLLGVLLAVVLLAWAIAGSSGDAPDPAVTVPSNQGSNVATTIAAASESTGG